MPSPAPASMRSGARAFWGAYFRPPTPTAPIQPIEVIPFARWRNYFDESKIARHPKGSPEGGKFAPKGGAAEALSAGVEATEDRAWTGERRETKSHPSKQAVGRIAEQVAAEWLRAQGAKDAKPLNAARNNFPLDLVHDSEVVEVKAGLVSNGSDAQKWRATLGEPGPAEKAWLAKAGPEQNARWNAKKQAAVLARKEAAAKAVEKALGRKVRRATLTMIVDPDRKVADIYRFEGFHSIIRWGSPEAEKAHVGSVRFAAEFAAAPLDEVEPDVTVESNIEVPPAVQDEFDASLAAEARAWARALLARLRAGGNGKAAAFAFDPAEHPRDEKGRFIETVTGDLSGVEEGGVGPMPFVFGHESQSAVVPPSKVRMGYIGGMYNPKTGETGFYTGSPGLHRFLLTEGQANRPSTGDNPEDAFSHVDINYPRTTKQAILVVPPATDDPLEEKRWVAATIAMLGRKDVDVKRGKGLSVIWGTQVNQARFGQGKKFSASKRALDDAIASYRPDYARIERTLDDLQDQLLPRLRLVFRDAKDRVKALIERRILGGGLDFRFVEGLELRGLGGLVPLLRAYLHGTFLAGRREAGSELAKARGRRYVKGPEPLKEGEVKEPVGDEMRFLEPDDRDPWLVLGSRGLQYGREGLEPLKEGETLTIGPEGKRGVWRNIGGNPIFIEVEKGQSVPEAVRQGGGKIGGGTDIDVEDDAPAGAREKSRFMDKAVKQSTMLRLRGNRPLDPDPTAAGARVQAELYLKQMHQWSVSSGREVALTLDNRSGRPVTRLLRGGETSVNMGKSLLAMEVSGDYTDMHTHPGRQCSSFSAGDVAMFLAHPQIRRSVVRTADGGTHILEKPAGWRVPDPTGMSSSMAHEYDKLISRLRPHLTGLVERKGGVIKSGNPVFEREAGRFTRAVVNAIAKKAGVELRYVPPGAHTRAYAGLEPLKGSGTLVFAASPFLTIADPYGGRARVPLAPGGWPTILVPSRPGPTRVPPESVPPAAAIDYFERKSLEWKNILSLDLLADIKRVLLGSITTGEPPEETYDALERVFGPYVGDLSALPDQEQVQPYRLETLVRTNTTEAFNQGRKDAFADSVADGFVTGYEFSAILDTRTTECCRFLNGQILPPEGKTLDRLVPPRHFNCRSLLSPITRIEDPAPEFISDADFERAIKLSGEGFSEEQRARAYAGEWDEVEHPREAAGSEEGGQFAPAGVGTEGPKQTSAQWHVSLDENEKSALDKWVTGGAFMKEVHETERSGNLPSAAVLKFQQAAAKAPTMSGVIYRGIGGLDEEEFNKLIDSKIISLDVSSSFSASGSVAEKFALKKTYDKESFIILKVLDGHGAKDLSAANRYGEREAVFGPGTWLQRVDSKEVQKGNKYGYIITVRRIK